MSGGVSYVDTFDPKPDLDRYHGQPLAALMKFAVRLIRESGEEPPPMPSPPCFSLLFAWDIANRRHWPVYVIHMGDTHTSSPSACSPRT